MSISMGVGEQHQHGRPTWIQVRQNSMSYTLQMISCIIFIIKLMKRCFYGDFYTKSSIFMTQFASFISVSSYLYSFLCYFKKFLYQFAVRHHLQTMHNTLPMKCAQQQMIHTRQQRLHGWKQMIHTRQQMIGYARHCFYNTNLFLFLLLILEW